MKKQNSIAEKLKSFSLFTSAIVATTASADAQVTYTDVSPDFQGSDNSEFNLDLNNNGTIDFIIEQTQSTWDSSVTWEYVNIHPQSGNSASPNQFDSGHLIDSNLTGLTTNPTVLAKFLFPFSWFGGDWLGVSQKFVGVKFTEITGQHYGWIRLSVNNKAKSYTVHDYAYEAIPDNPIIAGVTGCTPYFSDADGDSYGASSDTGTVFCSFPVTGFSFNNYDCDDTNSNVYPGAEEILFNGIDDNCDGYIDEFGTDIFSFTNSASVFSLFPNPTNGEFLVHLQLSNELNAEAKVEVINLLGQAVYNKTGVLLKGKLEEEIKLNNKTASGIYLVRVMVKDRVFSGQIVYEK